MHSVFDTLPTNDLLHESWSDMVAFFFVQGMEKKWGTRSKGIDVENEYVALHVLYSF